MKKRTCQNTIVILFALAWVNEGGLTLELTGWMTSISGIVGLGRALFIPILVDRLGSKPSASILAFYSAVSMFIIYANQGLLAKIVFVLVIGCCGFLTVLLETCMG